MNGSSRIKGLFGAITRRGKLHKNHDVDSVIDKGTSDWPFEDSKDAMAFTSVHIIQDNKPILYVAHDEDDGSWQFHSGELTSIKEAMLVTLEEIYKLDRSIGLLHSLPLGSVAERKSEQHEWIVKRHE